jgi:broad specificity phosphatase PhoE
MATIASIVQAERERLRGQAGGGWPVVYLVRHAHAGKKSQWRGPDLARPLSAQGRAEADGLIERLGPHRVRRVLSSPAERCLQTVRPLAGRRGLPVELSEALAVDGSAAGVQELLVDPAMREAVLCTHGEVIGKVFDRLCGLGLRLPDRARWPKGSTWAIDREGGHAWTATYLAPLSHPAAVSPSLLRWPPGDEEVAGT